MAVSKFTIYRSTDPGAPTLSGQVGKLTDVLDKCLVTGYSASVTSITRSGSTATVTTPVPHNLLTGQSVTIAGAVETDYNGTFVVTVTSTTVFTYTVPGTPSTPATGTITYLRIAAGWTKPFTGTNKASFRQGTGSNQFYLRVDDNAPGTASDARIRGFETMSDVDSGTGDFPTVAQQANGIFARKSATADATTRSWIVVADARTFYMFVNTGDTNPERYRAFCFGEFYSLLSGDNFRCVIAARSGENGTATSDTLDLLTLPNAVTSMFFVARGHNGTGGSVNVGRHGDRVKGAQLGWLAGNMAYTNPANGAFYVSRVWIHDPTTSPANGLRGRMRGLWHWLHPIAGVTDGEALTGTGELAGKTFLVVKQGGNTGLYIIETSNTVETN